MTLEPPVAYQGGKTRLASEIADQLIREERLLGANGGSKFYDLCCGCGAVSIALVEKGVDLRRIHMIDGGPWGDFWMRIGAGTFDVDYFASVLDLVPKDPRQIKWFMEVLAERPVDDCSAYFFPVLQAGAFGGKPVTIREGRWVTPGFRSYWEPTATSNRRSPVNPMMPMPETLLQRVRELAVRMRGVVARQQDLRDPHVPRGSVAYLDPPYGSLTGYAPKGFYRPFSSLEFALDLAQRGSTCVVSESKPFGEAEVLIQLSGGRKKGGVSGKRASAHEEWISIFRPQAGLRATSRS